MLRRDSPAQEAVESDGGGTQHARADRDLRAQGISEEAYHQGCQEETGIFAQLPGLIAKIWLPDSAANQYGAVYLGLMTRRTTRTSAAKCFSRSRTTQP